MNEIYKINGENAMRLAARDGLTLRKYADPVDVAQDEISATKAREVARIDPSLVYVEVVHQGWWIECFQRSVWIGCGDGVNISDYFRGHKYLGPDLYGLEPTFADARPTVDTTRPDGQPGTW